MCASSSCKSRQVKREGAGTVLSAASDSWRRVHDLTNQSARAETAQTAPSVLPHVPAVPPAVAIGPPAPHTEWRRGRPQPRSGTPASRRVAFQLERARKNADSILIQIIILIVYFKVNCFYISWTAFRRATFKSVCTKPGARSVCVSLCSLSHAHSQPVINKPLLSLPLMS